ncbi:MAG: putative quinol monooxygenase [Erythrobacter sp.]|jgi:quinol monooxygenase YgiN|nr:putative quinol monooxygenase [Erythrobacter sp.]
MLIVLGTARLGEDALKEGRAAFEAMIAASRAEEGCIDYACSLDLLDPTMLRIMEKWAREEAPIAHLRTPHMAAFQHALSELEVAITQIARHAADDGAPLM